MSASNEARATSAAGGEGGAVERRGYFGGIWHAAKTIFEGMAITFTEMLRLPINHTTVQYPDRTSRPVVDMLPERYRGFLEVDMEVCNACRACERDCPIGCIRIDLEKIEGVRAMTRFDIDLGKCMYCGLCVEACSTEAQAPDDAEPTKAIRMTREFEGAVDHLESLTFRFIRPGDKVVPGKAKKGEIAPTRPRGEIAREARKHAAEYNALACQSLASSSSVNDADANVDANANDADDLCHEETPPSASGSPPPTASKGPEQKGGK